MCYATALERDLGVTPVFVRYNTGRHISDNGRDLAALVEQIVAAWPVPVEEVSLVGHSMGGLVSRSAAACASARSCDHCSSTAPRSAARAVSDAAGWRAMHSKR